MKSEVKQNLFILKFYYITYKSKLKLDGLELFFLVPFIRWIISLACLGHWALLLIKTKGKAIETMFSSEEFVKVKLNVFIKKK